jgi:hypothetical protein
MRRCFAIGLAVLVLALGARGVAAQDDGQSASDRLLEILKQRQIISEDEYSELKGLASKLEAENSEISRRLGELDRSIADYLSKGDDEEYNRAHVSYKKGQGFQFATADGLFELNLGGFFLFTYTGMDMGRMNTGYRYEPAKPVSSSVDGYLPPRADAKDYRWDQDTNNFDVQENRIHLFGHAFMKDLTWFVEFDGAGESSSVSESLSDYPNGYIDQAGYFYTYSGGNSHEDTSVELLEAWVNYDHCGYFEVKFGQMKPPTDRNFLIHESDLAFPERCLVNDVFSLQRDVGVQIHDMREFKAGDTTMAYDYAFGIFNGEGTGASYNDSSNVGYSFRTTFYPLGYLDYTESDFACTEMPKVALGFWYGHHKADQRAPTFSERIQSTMHTWGFDATVAWQGLYATAEYISRDTYVNQRQMYYTDGEGHSVARNSGGFVQAGYFIKDMNLEVLGRLAVTHVADDPSYDTTYWQDNSGYYSNSVWVNEVSELSLGLAYYFSGHDWKVTFDMGKVRVDFKHMKDEINDYVRLAFWLNW